MNICFCNSEKHWGGGEKWHFKMALKFAQSGTSVYICSYPDGELEKRSLKSNINIFSVKLSRIDFINPFKYYKIYRFFKDNKIEAVFMNNPLDLKIYGIAAKLAGVKHIIYRRGMPHPIKNTLLNRFLFGRILTNLIVISKEVERSIFKNNPFIIDRKKVLLLYNAIDSSDYNPVDKQADSSCIIFGNTGRLVEQKGQHHLLQVASILKSKGYKFKILIAGIGPLEEKLKSEAASLGLEDYVIFTGFIEDLTPFMNSIDVFVFPSYFEGSANSLVEAVYFGKPSIVFDVSTMPELVKNNITGFIVPFKNTSLFAEKMEAFILSPELIVKMGAAAVKERPKYVLDEVYNTLRDVVSS